MATYYLANLLLKVIQLEPFRAKMLLLSPKDSSYISTKLGGTLPWVALCLHTVHLEIETVKITSKIVFLLFVNIGNWLCGHMSVQVIQRSQWKRCGEKNRLTLEHPALSRTYDTKWKQYNWHSNFFICDHQNRLTILTTNVLQSWGDLLYFEISCIRASSLALWFTLCYCTVWRVNMSWWWNCFQWTRSSFSSIKTPG